MRWQWIATYKGLGISITYEGFLVAIEMRLPPLIATYKKRQGSRA